MPLPINPQFQDPRLNHTPAAAGFGEGNPGVRPPMVNPIAQRAGMQVNAPPAVAGGGIVAPGTPYGRR